jgi:gliding motility-associated-like protein
MKKLFLALTSFLFFVNGTAQNDDCINAIPLCSTPSFTFFANSGPGNVLDFSTASSISNPVNNPFPPNNGCLKAGELNPQWLLLTVGNAGMLEFVFGAVGSANPQAGCYDWIMWPYSPTTCAGIFNNTLPPIRCNWNGTCANGTGIASATNIAVLGGNTLDFEPPLAVNACQQFIICISNYSGVNTLVSFQSIGTASLSCSPNCNPNYSMCAGGQATIVPVNFAALANPSFSIQPGGSVTTTGSFVVSPTITSTYTTYITGTNQNNAVQTITAASTVTVYAQPALSPTVIQSTCTNSLSTVNLGLSWSAGQAIPNYTVTWAPIPTGVVAPQQSSVNAFVQPGVYSATVTTANGCKATATFVIDSSPAPAQINLSPVGNSHIVTCAQPLLIISALDAANNYTWSNGIIMPIQGPQAQMTFTTIGTWTITAINATSGCVATKTISVGQSTNFPTAQITPTLQNITCNFTSIQTITATANPTVNVSHYIMAPQGGTFTANSHTMVYTPGGVGEFTHCAVNDANGCSTCRTFTVTSNQGFPSFSVTSPQNFSLGCTTRSVATINIVGATSTPPGGPISYTMLVPSSGTATSTGTLSSQSVYTVNIPGSYTFVTKDNTSFCETRVPVSVLSNTFAPDISAIVPRQILDCYVPSTVLRGQSLNSNVSYNWSFPGIPGNQPGDTLTVGTKVSAPTQSLIANFTLTITDNSSTCKSTSLIPIYQNLFLPNAIVVAGTGSLTCKTPTVVLTNQSSTGIPPATGFSTISPVIGFLWQGPSPQEDGQLSSTYLGATIGIYTMTAKDLNNGCIKTATVNIDDGRDYPIVNQPVVPGPFVLDCGDKFRNIYPIITNTTSSLAYTWTAPAGATISSQNSPTLSVTKPGIYRILTTNTQNGCATLAEIPVTAGSLTAGVAADKSQGFAPLTITFSNTSLSSTGNGSIATVWSFGNGTSTITSSAFLSPVVLYSQPGTYTVQTYSSKGVCSDTARMTVRVEIPSFLEVPNVFTPNGDKVNDVFFLRADNLSEIDFKVTDRWGSEVTTIHSLSGNITWDGRSHSGKDASDGVYFYILKAKGVDGQDFEKKGTITILR